MQINLYFFAKKVVFLLGRHDVTTSCQRRGSSRRKDVMSKGGARHIVMMSCCYDEGIGGVMSSGRHVVTTKGLGVSCRQDVMSSGRGVFEFARAGTVWIVGT